MKERLIASLGAICALVTCSGLNAQAASLNVVASIAPIHSLVTGVMKGAGKPHLIIKGAGSPHTYSMKPSDASALSKADIIFWVGPELETFLEHPLETLGKNALQVELMDADGVERLSYRKDGAWEKHMHDHDDHHEENHGSEEKEHHSDHHEEHDKHADHDEHEDHDKHADHEEHDSHSAHEDHEDKHGEHHDEHADHAEHAEHENADAHMWMSPDNAAAMVRTIAKTLSEKDPKNEALYQKNAKDLSEQLSKLSQELSISLKEVKQRPFIVFHDSFQYFEKAFGLNGAGSVTISPEKQPGARRVKEIRKKVMDLGAVCIFSEPQFAPKIVKVLAENTKANIGVLDPLGSDIEPGPKHYFALLRKNASALKTCLSNNN